MLYPLEQYAFDAEQCQLSQRNKVIHAYLDTKKLRLVDNKSLALRDALNGMKNTLEKEMKQYYATIATWPLNLKQMQSFPKFKRWYILSYAVSYIDSAQKIWCYDDNDNSFRELEDLLGESNNSVNKVASLFANIFYLFPAGSLSSKFNWFWLRFGARDIESNAINPVITITPPKWSCVQFFSWSLPEDFLEIKSLGWSWINFNTRTQTNKPLQQIQNNSYKKTYCGIEQLKIVLPKEPNFFNNNVQGMWWSSPYGIGFTAWEKEDLPYPSCGLILFSADNAQYREVDFCIQKPILPKNFIYFRFIEDAIKDWLMTLQ